MKGNRGRLPGSVNARGALGLAAKLQEENERLRAALGPLAREADNWTDDVDGDTRILFTLELCRKARSALQSRQGAHP